MSHIILQYTSHKHKCLTPCHRFSCPNLCSGRGICGNPDGDGGYYCSCYLGFNGDDCSQNSDDGVTEGTAEAQTEAEAAEIRAIILAGETDEGIAAAVVTETVKIMTSEITYVAIKNTVPETVKETTDKSSEVLTEKNSADIVVDTAAVTALDTAEETSAGTVGEESVVTGENKTEESPQTHSEDLLTDEDSNVSNNIYICRFDYIFLNYYNRN